MLDNKNEDDLGIKDEDGGDDKDLNGQSRRSSARPKTGHKDAGFTSFVERARKLRVVGLRFSI